MATAPCPFPIFNKLVGKAKKSVPYFLLLVSCKCP